MGPLLLLNLQSVIFVFIRTASPDAAVCPTASSGDLRLGLIYCLDLLQNIKPFPGNQIIDVLRGCFLQYAVHRDEITLSDNIKRIPIISGIRIDINASNDSVAKHMLCLAGT